MKKDIQSKASAWQYTYWIRNCIDGIWVKRRVHKTQIIYGERRDTIEDTVRAIIPPFKTVKAHDIDYQRDQANTPAMFKNAKFFQKKDGTIIVTGEYDFGWPNRKYFTGTSYTYKFEEL